MPDDPRDRRTPPKGLPIPKPVRGLTERGASRHLDLSKPKHDFLAKLGKEFESEEVTPVTMIAMVREELKDDIGSVSKEVDGVKDDVKEVANKVVAMDSSLTKLTAEVSVTNKLMPQVVEAIKSELQSTRDELRSRRAIDDQIVMSKVEVTRHREIAEADVTKEYDIAKIRERTAWERVKQKASIRLITALTSTAVVTAIVTFLATKC